MVVRFVSMRRLWNKICSWLGIRPNQHVHDYDPELCFVVRISEKFSQDEATLIQQGIDMWCDASLGRLSVTYLTMLDPDSLCADYGYIINVHRVESIDPWVKKWDDEHKKVILGMSSGSYDQRGHVNVGLIADRLKNKRSWRAIAAHEFGHAIGIDHVSDGCSIMSEYVQASSIKRLTRHDKDALERIFSI